MKSYPKIRQITLHVQIWGGGLFSDGPFQPPYNIGKNKVMVLRKIRESISHRILIPLLITHNCRPTHFYYHAARWSLRSQIHESKISKSRNHGPKLAK